MVILSTLINLLAQLGGFMGFFGALKDSSVSALGFSISKEKIQKEIAKEFPKRYENILASLIIHNPIVLLSPEDDLVGLQMQVIAKAPLIGERKGCFSVRGEIFFDKERRAVFLRGAKIIEFSVPDLSAKISGFLKGVAEVGVGKILSEHPIYELPSGFVGNRVKNLNITEGEIVVSLGI